MYIPIHVGLLIAMVMAILVLLSLVYGLFVALDIQRREGRLLGEPDPIDDPDDVTLHHHEPERRRVYPDGDCPCRLCNHARSTQGD